MAAAIANRDTEWVLHAGLQDVDLLRDALELDELPSLFDTQVAWALLSPEAGVSLSYLEFRVLGLKNMKTHQTDDWMRRPLPRRQLEYAAADVLHLPRIEFELTRRAGRLGRRNIVLRASRDYLLPQLEPVQQLSLRSFRNAWQLAPVNQIALLGLIELLNRLRDDSGFPLPAPKSLLSIASRMPMGVEDLRRIKGVPQAFTKRHGREVIQCIKGASDTSRLGEVEALAPPAYASFEEVHVEAWLGVMRSDVCSRLGVSAEFVLPNKLLRSMRDHVLDDGDWRACCDALAGWRRDLVAGDVASFFEQRDLPLAPATPPAQFDERT